MQYQDQYRSISDQYQINIRSIPDQYQINIRSISRSISDQYQINIRSISDQYQDWSRYWISKLWTGPFSILLNSIFFNPGIDFFQYRILRVFLPLSPFPYRFRLEGPNLILRVFLPRFETKKWFYWQSRVRLKTTLHWTKKETIRIHVYVFYH